MDEKRSPGAGGTARGALEDAQFDDNESFKNKPPPPNFQAIDEVAERVVARLRAQLYSDGTFDWAPDGELVYVVAVPGADGSMEDIAVWLPDDPCRWWLRRQVSVILGQEEVERCDFTGSLLDLFETPSHWIKARGKGAVILRWDACLRFYLPQHCRIRCQTARLARRVATALAPPQDSWRVEVADG